VIFLIFRKAECWIKQQFVCLFICFVPSLSCHEKVMVVLYFGRRRLLTCLGVTDIHVFQLILWLLLN